MKELVLIIGLFCCINSLVLWAQVPDSVRHKFETDYPDMKNPQWSPEGSGYKVTYKDKQDVEHSVFYEPKERAYTHRYEMDVNNAPPSILDYFKKNSPDEKYKIWVEEDKSGKRTYYVPGSIGKYYFNSNGEFIRKE